MRRIKGLIKKYAKKLKDKKWYHQRFDGSLMFLFSVAEAQLKKEKRKPAGTESDILAGFYSMGKADWYIDMADIKQGSKVLIQLAKKNPKISTLLLRAWKKDEKKFEDFFWEEFPKIKLAKLSLIELEELWQKYYLLFINRVTSSSIIDNFALGTDKLIGRMLRKEVGKLNKESQFTQIFSVATAPIHQSFINQAEIDLLKIALGESKQTLADYQKKYFWTKNNYTTAQILDVKHFAKEIKVWKKSGKNLYSELTRIEQTPKLNKLKKQKLFKKFKFSPSLKGLIKISEDFTWWQDERKKSTYLNIHVGCQILKEIAKRTGYKLEELKYALPPEVKSIISDKVPSRQELQKREKSCGIFLDHEGWEIKSGKEVEKFKKIILGKKSYADIQDFRGLCASTGKAVGPVKVVKSATEVGKVKEGDILVAVMTRPDYVVAMKRCAAIVTNEGGITSHAAIVSRELGIPCIIGTKIATEVLKDGDLVEVNANHGWVRKLK